MLIQGKGIVVLLAVAFGSAALHATQTERTASGGAALQAHYDAAERFQKQGDLDKAAAEYRAFLADALGALAMDWAQAGDYAKAGQSFDEALAIAPDSPFLRLEFARMELRRGDLAHAEALARGFLQDYPTSKSTAEAHQILGRTLLGMNRDLDAKKVLERAVALDPSFANGYDLAVACLDLDDEKCAAQLFIELQASFGDTAELHMAFGRAYGNSDFAPRAVEEFRKAIALDPRLHGAHYSLAATLLATGGDGDKQEVETELKKELTVSPLDSLTYSALGKLAIANHQYADAERYLQHAVALDSSTPDAFLYEGQLYFDTSRFAEAEKALRQAILLTTDESRNRYQIQKAHYLLGRILIQERRPDEAQAEMQISRAFANKALARDKSKLGGLLQDKADATGSSDASTGAPASSAAAPVVLDHAAQAQVEGYDKQLAPAIADSYNNLGVIAATRADYAAALGHFGRAEAWNPSLDGLDYNWGRAAFSASRFSDAIAPLTRYLRAHPEVSSVRTALAVSQFMNQSYNECLATLQPAGEEIMSIPQIQYIHAASLVRTGQITSGKEGLLALEAAHPEIAEVHRSLGEVFTLEREPQKAASEFQRALQINPKDAETQYDLGKVELENGGATASIRPLETAVRLMPGNPEYHRELASAYRAAWRPSDADKELHVYESLVAAQSQPAKADTKSP